MFFFHPIFLQTIFKLKGIAILKNIAIEAENLLLLSCMMRSGKAFEIFEISIC